MKLNRGIIESNNNEGLVSWASTDNIFNIYYQIELKNAEVLVDYFKEKINSDEYTFQLIKGFEARKYDAYNSEYELGDLVAMDLKKDVHSIEAITYQ